MTKTKDIWFEGYRVRLTLHKHQLKYKSGIKERISITGKILGFNTERLINEIQKKELKE